MIFGNALSFKLFFILEIEFTREYYGNRKDIIIQTNL